MNTLDKQYTDLLQDILDNGTQKGDRTGTGTLSVFGRQIRHKMSEGFPLLTTKKMYTKGIITELLWILRGDTNIKYLIENKCDIWTGDAYKSYKKYMDNEIANSAIHSNRINVLSKTEFSEKVKTDDEFAKQFGELGPIYGKQWRKWGDPNLIRSTEFESFDPRIDQFANLIATLKKNPNDRRMMVTAWNPVEVEAAVLPPCHYGFQVWTRELSLEERHNIFLENRKDKNEGWPGTNDPTDDNGIMKKFYDEKNIPQRAISLMWNQRSCDTPLGIPFNIASYGLLLMIIGEIVNMVPEDLIGNLGDTHIYMNQILGVKAQLGHELTEEEYRITNSQLQKLHEMYVLQEMSNNFEEAAVTKENYDSLLASLKQPRIPYELPLMKINTEFWAPGTEDGCGMGPGTYDSSIDTLIRGIEPTDFYIMKYQSYPSINFPLSN